MLAFEVLFISPNFRGFLLTAELNASSISECCHCERLELEFSTEVSRIVWPVVVFMLSIISFHFHSTSNHIGSLKRPNTQHAQYEPLIGGQRFEYVVVFPHFHRLKRKSSASSLLSKRSEYAFRTFLPDLASFY